MRPLSLDELWDESNVYAADREGVNGMRRVDEVALAYRDGYRRALGDISIAINRGAGPSYRDGEEQKP